MIFIHLRNFSTLNRLNLKWGTETPIQLEDPKYDIIVPVRAYGQYGFRVKDPEKFIYGIVGNKSDFSESMLQSYFCLIREKVVTFRMVKLNLLLSIFCITK